MTEPEAPEPPSPKPSGMVDLSDLRMMPSWVAGGDSSSNLSKYEGREDRGPRRDGGRDRDRRSGPPPRRDGGFGGGGPGRGGDFRPRRDGPPGQGQGHGGGPRRDRDDRGGPRRFGGRDRDHGPAGRGGHDRPQREWVEMPKDIKVVIEPEDKSAEALANHIRGTGHAFSMFDAARLVLAESDRYHARFTCAPERATGLFVSLADGGLFLSREEALSHVLRSPAIDAYYRTEEVELEEPKGDFRSIGVCGMSGEILGPPSHHSFQSSLLRLHRERFPHLPLEEYKRRVRTDTTPEMVARWKENQRKGQRWIYTKDQAEDAEPVVLASRAEMEAHFRRLHSEDAVVEGRDVVIPGSQDRSKITHILGIMMRNAVEGARKHLFDMAQKLGGVFERRGLKLFKRRAGKLFVCRVKPRAVDPGVVFSERVAKIVEVLKSKPGMPLAQLVEAIVPGQQAEAAAPEPAVESQAAPEPAPAVEEGAEAPAPAAESEPAPAPAPAASQPQLTDDQISVLKDLRWLTNEGYVIEYSDGMVFLGVQGEPQAPKPPAQPSPEPAAAEAAGAEPAATSETAEAPAAAAESETGEVPATEAETPPSAAADVPVVEEVTAPAVTQEAAASAEEAAPAQPEEPAAPAAEEPAPAPAETEAPPSAGADVPVVEEVTVPAVAEEIADSAEKAEEAAVEEEKKDA